MYSLDEEKMDVFLASGIYYGVWQGKNVVFLFMKKTIRGIYFSLTLVIAKFKQLD